MNFMFELQEQYLTRSLRSLKWQEEYLERVLAITASAVDWVGEWVFFFYQGQIKQVLDWLMPQLFFI